MTSEKHDKSRCTKEHPWDKATVPVLHVDARFVGDTELMECPNCGNTWMDTSNASEVKGSRMTKPEIVENLKKTLEFVAMRMKGQAEALGNGYPPDRTVIVTFPELAAQVYSLCSLFHQSEPL